MRRLTDAGVGLFRNLVDRAAAIGHRTAWFHGGNVLIFISWNQETVDRAHEALGAANCLCQTDLWPAMTDLDGNTLPELPSTTGLTFLEEIIDEQEQMAVACRERMGQQHGTCECETLCEMTGEDRDL